MQYILGPQRVQTNSKTTSKFQVTIIATPSVSSRETSLLKANVNLLIHLQNLTYS